MPVSVRASFQSPTGGRDLGTEFGIHVARPSGPHDGVAGGWIVGTGEIAAEARNESRVIGERTDWHRPLARYARRSIRVIWSSVSTSRGDAFGAARLIMVIQNSRQARIQNIAMKLTRRSAVRSRASSARQPDLRIFGTPRFSSSPGRTTAVVVTRSESELSLRIYPCLLRPHGPLRQSRPPYGSSRCGAGCA